AKRMGRDGIENLPEIQGGPDGPAHLAHGAHVLERVLQRHPALLELEGPLANAILQGSGQLLQLGEGLSPVVHRYLQRPRHAVEGGGQLPDLVPRLHGDLLLELARRNLLGLLGQLLDGLRDAPREAVDDDGTDREERHGDTAPELRERPHLLLDARERYTHPHASVDLLALRLRTDASAHEHSIWGPRLDC